jgi:branched-chain amino acid aminotransferase
VEERKISVDEVFEAQKKGILQDAFGTGTAASIVPISHIHHRDATIELPAMSSRPYCIRFKDEMEEIKAGIRPDPFGWSVKVQSKILVEAY